MVSRVEIFFECDSAKHPAQRWKAVFYFYERGKNTDVEQCFEACTFELQVNERGEDSAASFLLSMPRKSIFGIVWGSSFPEVIPSVC